MSSYPLLETVTPLLNLLPTHPAFAKKEFPEFGFGVICYLYSGPDVFPGEDKDPAWALLREMRGIKYDLATGMVLSRTYEKFFNKGEKPFEDLTAFIESGKMVGGAGRWLNDPRNYTLEFKKKRDGSMISFIDIDRQFVPLTKKAFSEAATACHDWLKASPLKSRYEAAIREFYDVRMSDVNFSSTLLFEWENPARPIVVQHKEPNLVLIDIRNNYTGDYMPYEELESIARFYDIPVVERVAHGVPATEIGVWQEIAKNLPDEEGYVYSVMNTKGVVLQKGKLKATRYCELHRANDGAYTGQRLDTIRLILQDAIDDFLPLLTPFYRDVVSEITTEVNKNVAEFARGVFEFCRANKTLAPKPFALKVKDEIDSMATGYYFKCRDILTYDEVLDKVKEITLNRLHKESEIPNFAFVLGNPHDAPT